MRVDGEDVGVGGVKVSAADGVDEAVRCDRGSDVERRTLRSAWGSARCGGRRWRPRQLIQTEAAEASVGGTHSSDSKRCKCRGGRGVIRRDLNEPAAEYWGRERCAGAEIELDRVVIDVAGRVGNERAGDESIRSRERVDARRNRTVQPIQLDD